MRHAMAVFFFAFFAVCGCLSFAEAPAPAGGPPPVADVHDRSSERDALPREAIVQLAPQAIPGVRNPRRAVLPIAPPPRAARPGPAVAAALAAPRRAPRDIAALLQIFRC
ncbi:hypothetical protein [Actinomadura parmotrematis]|uniref:Uncharacterized protein n=1 Tax=Actinomadura parmotrematis TaxID=2864039 RepID=A0ABS7FVD7_9ACTN|nr:hypothetical protein [Actinomadura parmotrematis]MBW8484384.1 hypothetical protein [Actinomadura parmotrematis]